MKKIFKGILSVALAASMFTLPACNFLPGSTGGTNSSNTGGITNPTEFSVTFNLNYSGAPSATVTKVPYDEVPTVPSRNPERDNYEFTGWYTDKNCTTKLDPEDPIVKNTTFYAGWKLVSVVLTFDAQGGSSVAAKTVKVGEKATQPTNPTKTGYLFDGWYTTTACTTAFDFTKTLNADTTVYAKWTQDTGDNAKVTYMLNYDGAENGGVYNEATIEKNTRPKAPADPQREGYVFMGWHTDAACENEYDFAKGSRITENTTMYAKWFKIYTFEAEHTYLTGKQGFGYSSGASGADMAVPDRNNIGASGGFWVSYLYYKGAFLEFNINSSEAVDDATMDLRLSVEFNDFTMSTENFTIEVNGTPVAFKSVALTGALQGEDDKRPFETYSVIAEGFSLKEGDNTIKLIVNNEAKFEIGTMKAYAPLIDCMYINTDATLTWEPYTSNTENR